MSLDYHLDCVDVGVLDEQIVPVDTFPDMRKLDYTFFSSVSSLMIVTE
jgi:hypothetical protein